MATNYNPKIVTDGLVLALDAGNTKSYSGIGTAWYDTSGSGYTGTGALSGMGSTHFDSANAGSFEFFGHFSENQIDIDLGDSLVKDFTLDFWIKTSATTQGNGAIAYGQNEVENDLNYGFIAAYNLSSSYCSFAWGAENRKQFVATSENIADNEWHHIVQNYDGTNAKAYIDTNLVIHNSTSFSGNLRDCTSNLRIGRWRDSGYVQDMKISAIKVYNKALTASEVKENFDALRGRYGI